MKEIVLFNSPVVFNEEEHRYFLGDKELFGITSTLIRRAFPNKYSNIPSETLANAARKGSAVHEAIEFHDHFGGGEDNPRIASYIRIKQENGLRTLANEYTVSDDEHYASKIDIVMANESDEICLVDTKTTYNLDKVSTALQLTIYRRFFEKQNPDLKVAHIYVMWLPNKDETIGELHELSFVEDSFIDELIEADLNDRDNEYQAVPEDWTDLEEAYAKWVAAKEQAELHIAEVKQKMIELMKQRNLTSIKSDAYSFSYIPASAKKSFDSALFKKEHEEMYNQYMKDSKSSEQIRISVRKPRTEE